MMTLSPTTDHRRDTLPATNDTVLARIIRERRQAMGLSQSKLADRLYCDHSLVSRIESGTRSPSIDLVANLGNVMEIPLADLALAVHGLDPETIRAELRREVRAELVAWLNESEAA